MKLGMYICGLATQFLGSGIFNFIPCTTWSMVMGPPRKYLPSLYYPARVGCLCEVCNFLVSQFVRSSMWYSDVCVSIGVCERARQDCQHYDQRQGRQAVSGRPRWVGASNRYNESWSEATWGSQHQPISACSWKLYQCTGRRQGKQHCIISFLAYSFTGVDTEMLSPKLRLRPKISQNVKSFVLFGLSDCSDDVSHCQILSRDKTEWRLFSATLCGWGRCFVADQLWLMKRIREEEEVTA